MKKICLVCNAHLDLVWQWEWEEGLAEALSTFRIAADFCEEYDGFIFNHNEAVLYQWVEEYEPELFDRIRRLVKAGKWHIMGGWYLQPDCNMPSGESMVRQISAGRAYFREKFGQMPTTAINFDAFGHSRGLAQILKRAGYDSYIVGRPAPELFHPPARDFAWVGYDGSVIATHLSFELYNSLLGQAADKIQRFRRENPDAELLLVLWGIGDHGGGPSRLDLERIGELKRELAAEGVVLEHTTPEDYFAQLSARLLPRFEGSLNPMMVGCYTSQARVKQKHRALENLLFSTEKMVCAAQWQTGRTFDWSRIKEAEQALLFSQFHDVLPGSSVQRAEEASLRKLDYGLELLSRERMKAFMAFAANTKVDRQEGDIPVLVFNAHPYPIRRVVTCEFQLQDQNRSGTFTDFEVYQDGKRIPAQLEKEDSTIPIDWRKKILFEAELAPFAVTTVLCRPVIRPGRPVIRQPEGDGILLRGGGVTAEICRETGLLRSVTRQGQPVLAEDSARLLVIQGSEDPWGMTVSSYPHVVGAFRLASPERAGEIAGLSHPLSPVRVIEEGNVRTVAEAVFEYGHSAAIVRYRMEHGSGHLEIDVTLQWMEPDKMVKLSLRSPWEDTRCWGQDLFGRKPTAPDGTETVCQQWTLLENGEQALAVINTGLYAHDFRDGELRVTLLHSPAYCAHPVDDLTVLPQDRYLPRIDIGRRCFRLVLAAGDREELLKTVDTAAQAENEPPFALSFFPSGRGGGYKDGMRLDNRSILLSAVTRREGDDLIRLFNPLPEPQRANLTIPAMRAAATLTFTPFEIKTLLLKDGTLREVLLDGSENAAGKECAP